MVGLGIYVCALCGEPSELMWSTSDEMARFLGTGLGSARGADEAAGNVGPDLKWPEFNFRSE
jgi:hypothetical protein